MTNADIAARLRELAIYLDMEGVPFKPRAYERVADAVEACEEPLAALYAAGGVKALARIPGVGKGIAERIGEILTTGSCRDLEAYRAAIPADVLSLVAIDGVGPKMVKLLHRELGVRTVADLQAAARSGLVRRLAHFGEKSEQRMLRSIAFLQQQRGRQPLGVVLDLAHTIAARLEAVPGVERAAIAGSIRRGRETVRDFDFLVVAADAAAVTAMFTAMPEVVQVLAAGPTKASVRLANGMDADLRIVPAASWGAALCYFTGSKDHNVALRRLAIAKGWKLNEYGLFDGERQIAGATEEDVYAALDLAWVPPELRENTGEIELARTGRLPELIAPGSLRGDLQIQTTWTDGAQSIEEMATAAQAIGLEYIAITDHTRGLTMARGSDEQQLMLQAAEIRRLNAKMRGFRILAGAEVNIERDGGLDIADEALARLDVVGIAVHSHFGLSRDEQTRRIVRAMEHPHAHILFHPTGRLLGRREPYEVDMDAVIAAALRTGTVLEIDAYADRMDLRDEHVRQAVAAGVKLAIDSDAHNVLQLRYPEQLGLLIARRGWATAADVINTRPVEEMLALLKGRRAR